MNAKEKLKNKPWNWSDNDKIRQKQARQAFRELGFDGFPENEEQLTAWNEKFKDYPYKLTGKEINPDNIIKVINRSIP